MTHYGIWVRAAGDWLVDDSGIIFWTTSEAVARAQLAKFQKGVGRGIRLEVRPFEETTSPASYVRGPDDPSHIPPA